MIDAQCTGVQLLVDGQPFNAITLYKPVGSSGIFVNCSCTTGNKRPDWFNPNGTKVLQCRNNERTTNYCTRTHDITPARALEYTSFMESEAGVYKCMRENVMTSLTIAVLSEFA